MAALPTRPLKIGFWGNFGTQNWGNECTLQAIVHNVRERLPDAELCCFSSEPTDTERRHGLRAFPISRSRRTTADRPTERLAMPLRFARRFVAEVRDWYETFRVARQMDIVVMTGTGMLTDTSEGSFGLPYDMFKWAVTTKMSGKKLFFTSVGVEPIHRPIAKFFILAALRLADYRSYRDAQSRDHLLRIGFRADEDSVFPDLAFSLPKELADDRAHSRAPQKAKVAVGVYDYRGRGAGGASDAAAYGAYLEKLGTFVLWLLEHEHRVRIIIGDLSYDEPVRRDLRAWLEARGLARYRERFEDEPARSVGEIIEQIADVDLVVASRFHNVLLALFLAKPVASVSYNVKNDALVGQMGLSSYCQLIDALEVDRLIDQVSRLERDAAQLRPLILEKTAAYRDDLARQYTLLFGPGAPPEHQHLPARSVALKDCAP